MCRFWRQAVGQTANFKRLDQGRWWVGLKAIVQSDLVLPNKYVLPRFDSSAELSDSARLVIAASPGQEIKREPESE